MAKNLDQANLALAGSLPVLDTFPYLNVRLCQGFYQILLLPEDLPQQQLLALAARQVQANRLRACLVLGEKAAIYFERDGASTFSEQPPAGGIIEPGIALVPAWRCADSESYRRRVQRLADYTAERNRGTRHVLGDLTKGGRPAGLDEQQRLRGSNEQGVPRGLRQCAECGYWAGECLDPNPKFRGQIMTVHCLCANDNRCAGCGELLAGYRLNANYYEAADGLIWHVPGFAGLSHQCAAKAADTAGGGEPASAARRTFLSGSDAAERHRTLLLVARSPRVCELLETLAEITGEERFRPRGLRALPEYLEAAAEAAKPPTAGQKEYERQIVAFLEGLIQELAPQARSVQ